MAFSSIIRNFTNSGKDFALVYASSLLPQRTISRVLILDSSFNPPHLAHSTLAKEAIDYHFNDGADQKLLLLLLSVKNADKQVPVPASFEHRLAMMQMMAKSLEVSGIPVAIGLTDHAKFADKASAIENYAKSNNSNKFEGEISAPHFNLSVSRLTFLLGFDTLVRVLDPKYYVPSTLKDALQEFMSNTDLFCLTRADHDDEFTAQHGYKDKIARGELPGVPSRWAQNIYMQTVGTSRDETGAISSSAVRGAYKQSSSPADLPLTEDVRRYIEEGNLYGKI